MEIRIFELKKVITSPIIIALLVLFIAFNSFIIFDNSYFKDELRVLNKIVDRFGYKIDDEMLAEFKEYYDSELKRLNKITEEKVSKNYSSISEFYKDDFYDIENIYTEDEVELIRELGIVEAYLYTIEEIDDVYLRLILWK